MTIPIRVINLERSPDRRAAMTEHLAERGLTPHFFKAVDGYRMSSDEIAEMQPGRNPRYGTPLKPGEIGLGASYRKLCLEIATGPDPLVCVLEDDVILSPRVAQMLDADYLTSLPRFDILRFGHGGMMRPGFCVVWAAGDGFSIVAPLFPQGLTLGTIVSRAGAARIAAGLVPLHTAIDTQLFNDGSVRNLRILQTEPSLAGARGSPSTITTEAEADWPKVGLAGRFTTRWARAAAIGRNIANFAGVWGPAAPFQALVRARRSSSRQAHGS